MEKKMLTMLACEHKSNSQRSSTFGSASSSPQVTGGNDTLYRPTMYEYLI